MTLSVCVNVCVSLCVCVHIVFVFERETKVLSAVCMCCYGKKGRAKDCTDPSGTRVRSTAWSEALPGQKHCLVRSTDWSDTTLHPTNSLCHHSPPLLRLSVLSIDYTFNVFSMLFLYFFVL